MTDLNEKLSILHATLLCEGAEEADSEDQLIDAWQLLIDTGVVWALQGRFGRTAAGLIEDGICAPAA